MNRDALEAYCTQMRADIALAKTQDQASHLKGEILGKKGFISIALGDLAKMSLEEKKQWGPLLSQRRQELITACQEKFEALGEIQRQARLKQEAIDVTLPITCLAMGSHHPIIKTMESIISIFAAMGFSLRDGPNVETGFYNFDALNIGKLHPARTSHDTFHLGPDTLLRTHTSCVQIRAMEEEGFPLAIMAPGRVYRADHDRTHSPMFHQLEVLRVEKTSQGTQGITMAHLKGCIEAFLTQFFGPDISWRLRPSFFPFTEPSAEVDLCLHRGPLEGQWLEVLGCGMVHPKALKSGISASEDIAQESGQDCALPPYTGFAMGMGIERLAMLKYGIEDLRPMFVNDQRWLRHYTPG